VATQLLPRAEDLEKHAEEVTGRQVLAKFKLVNITHARLGGYNARVTSSKLGFNEEIRTTSIKGVWRWWLRAALAGAYCDAGQSVDQKRGILTTREILGSVDRKSSFSLSLKRGGAGASPQLFQHEVDVPRLYLITQGLKGQDKEEQLQVYPPRKLEFEISVVKSDAKISASRVAIGSLILALLLGGAGSITRRGFGHFLVDMIFANMEVKELSDRLKALYAKPKTENLESLRNLIVQSAAETLGIAPRAGSPIETQIPQFPCLCRNHFRAEIHAVKLPIHNVSHENDEDYYERKLLEKIGKSVLKKTWKIIDPRNAAKAPANRQFVKGRQYPTWVLGLPRHAFRNESRHGGPSKVLTGYAGPNKGELRHPSSISIAPFIELASGKYLATVFGFKSLDWPSITHYSYGNVSPYPKKKDTTRTEELNESNKADQVPKAFDYAFKTVCTYLEGNDL
jgi:CRISPR type III-B/RAMP module RAMP protein Cmr1